MKKYSVATLSIAVLLISAFASFYFFTRSKKTTPKPLPLLSYTFDNIKNTKFPENPIILGKEISETLDILSQTFYFDVPERPGSKTMLKVSGLINTPKKSGTYPVIIMFRGYIPPETYQPGAGTQPTAKVLAGNGYITIAPDFLGYGESASASATLFEDRFQTYTTALTLLSSLPTLNGGLDASYSGKIKADLTKIGIWGHSNGGHIALSMLAVSGVSYPTVLWAPVSKSFPYSILYYTDETDDQGKELRKALSVFEKDYNTDLFSPASYYSWIKAPLEINQGTADEEVPYWWSDELVTNLKKDNVSVTYIKYPGADHNMLPTIEWSSAVTNSLDFFNKHL